MLHVIVLILKIIGIILLIILGLLVIIILTVLLVPIRYRIDAEHGEELLKINAKASWLLHLLNAHVTHLEGILHIRIKILWITLYDNLNPKEPKDKAKKIKRIKNINKGRTNKDRTNKDRTNNDRTNTDSTNTNRTNRCKTSIDTDREKRSGKDGKVKISKESSIVVKTTKTDENNKRINTDEVLKTVENTEEVKTLETTKTIESIKNSETTKTTEVANTVMQERNTGGTVIVRSRSIESIQVTKSTEGEKEKLPSFFEKVLIKISNLKEKIIALKDRIKSFFKNLKEKIVNLFESLTDIKQKFHLITDFIKDEMNRQGFRITYSSLKRILKHILPRKLKSRIVFGTGDPCSTGQALGFMSIIYSFYGDRVQIFPDFENKVLEGKHYAQGRIRLVTLLIIVIKLILDKRFQQLKKNFQLLKEAL